MYMVGSTSDRVHRGAYRSAQKRQRWMYVPKKKEPPHWIDVKLYLECMAVTLACILACFFVWLSVG